MQNNSITSQTDIANVTVVTEENQIIVPQPITNVIEVNNPGPQGPIGPQGVAGPSEPFANIGGGVYATTSSLQVSGSFLVSGSSTFTNIGPAIFSGSTSLVGATTMSSALVSGNVTVLGTASINTLIINQTVLSTGSNTLGDAANDTQTLYGSVIIPTGSLTVSGNVSFGTSSAGFFWDNTNSRLGIGTSSPSQALTITNGGIALSDSYPVRWGTSNLLYGTTSGLDITNTAFAVRFRFTTGGNLLIGTTSDPGARLYISGSTSQALLIASSSNGPALFVSGSGNVGIGTNIPTSQLHISGPTTDSSFSLLVQNSSGQTLFSAQNNRTVNINSTNAVDGDTTIGTTSGTITFNRGYNNTLLRNALTFYGGGDISTIQGWSSPTSGIAVGYAQTNINPVTGSVFTVKGTATTSGSGVLFVTGSSTTKLLTVASETNLSILVVSGSGRVGIGTTPSLATLDVNGNINSSNQFRNTVGLTLGTVSSLAQLYQATGVGLAYFDGANVVNGLVLKNTGNIGIGVDFQAPSATLHISGSSGSALLRVDSNASSSILYVSGSGNVGIGTISPTKALTVQANSNDEGILLRSSTGNTLFQVTRDGASNNTAEMFLYSGGAIRLAIRSTSNFSYFNGGNFGFGTATDLNARLGVRGSGTTNATTTFLLQNSTPTNLLSVLDNGQVVFTSPTMSLAASQSAFSISPIISASNIVGGQYYGVSITPTFFQTTGSQTETAFRVAATFTSSNATATSGSNIIADFGSTSAGSQLTVTDITSGSIYMVNDVSGIPIIEATSNWDVNIYDFPNKIFEKTGSQVNIYGTMRVSGSFILPLSQSATPQTGSAYWSGSLLFIYNGTRYMSASFV